MSGISKSLTALDNLLDRLTDAELNVIVAEVDSLDAVGPTISQYFEKFDSQFTSLFFEEPISLSHPIEYLKNIKYSQNSDFWQSDFDIKFYKHLQCEIVYSDEIQESFETEFLIAA